MVDPKVHAIAAETQALCGLRGDAPARDLRELVMPCREQQQIDFGDAAFAPDPFALLVAEAFDTFMAPLEWSGRLIPNCDPSHRASRLFVWTTHVGGQFDSRCSIG